jgi:hypothetical protein
VDVHPETWRVTFFFKKNWEKVGISWFSSRKKGVWSDWKIRKTLAKIWDFMNLIQQFIRYPLVH